MDVQLALASQDEPMDNTIIDGFETVERQVGEYSESNVDSAIIGSSSRDQSFKFLTGERMTESEIYNKSKELFNLGDEEEVNISKSGDGADVSTYSVSYKNENKSAYLDITEQGGHPITLLVNREVEPRQLSLHDGMVKAEEYLADYDFASVELYESSQYDDIGVYSFVYVKDDIRIHPDHIEVKVALDNGDIIGLNAKNYYLNHRERSIQQPKLTIDDVEQFVNGNVQLEEKSLAVIHNDLGEEVLTYEILGTYGNDTYRIFLHANDGYEEKVERLSSAEINYAQ